MGSTSGVLAWGGRQVGHGSVVVTADVTLTTEDILKRTLALTGAPTTAGVVTYPLDSTDRGYIQTVDNQSGQAMLLKIAGSVGVTVPAGAVRDIYFTGTDFGSGVEPVLGERISLVWRAGEKGLPQLNAVTDPPAGDTYNTAAMLALLNADREFEILGVNASSDDVTISAEGGIRVETDGANGDEVILLPHLNAGQSRWSGWTWGTDQEVEWECRIRSGAAITATILWAGLKLTMTEVSATDANQVFFRYEDDINSGKWQFVYAIGGVLTAVDTGITAVLSTEYNLRIAIDESRIARGYINGVLAGTSTALTNTTDFIPYIGIQNDGAGAAKHLDIYSQAISRKAA